MCQDSLQDFGGARKFFSYINDPSQRPNVIAQMEDVAIGM